MKVSVKNVSLFLFILISLCLYFYNFTNRINFGPEQGLSLLVSSEYINGKFSLLGLPNLQRTTSTGHTLYSGSLFNYSLIPLLLAFDYNPVAVTAFSALVILSGGIATVWVAYKICSAKVAAIAGLLYLFNGILIWHATYIWILNYLPLIGALSVYCLFLIHNQKRTIIGALALGFLTGVGFNLQYMYLFTIPLVLIATLYFSRQKITSCVLFVVGIFAGNLPMVLFDLKHDFFHARLLWQYFLDTSSNSGQSMLSYYHFLHFFPVIFILCAFLLSKLMKKINWLAYLFIACYVAFNLHSPWVDFNNPVGMPTNMKVVDFEKAATIIAADNPTNFNIASMIPMDNVRAYSLRYLVEYRNGFKPENYETYTSVQTVYVAAPLETDFSQGPWEVTAHSPMTIALLAPINSEFGVFKLSK